ncbi:MAG: transcription antitermination factor NusB [Planctomycetia bacterium]
MRSRTRARQLALQFLFQLDVQGDEARTQLEAFLDHELRGKPGGEEARGYALRVVDGVRTHRERLDGMIREAARNWDLERMAGVDRNALRIGCYELLHEPEVPMKVAINEAIELGKMYSTESSGAFINGILDRIRKDLGR